MKKAICTLLTILLLMCCACFVLFGCVSQEEMRKNSHKNVKLVEEYFTSTDVYGGCGKQLISGEEILGSHIMTTAAKEKFAADNKKLLPVQRYYDIYLGVNVNRDDPWKVDAKAFVVIVPLARFDERWVYECKYDINDDYEWFSTKDVMATFYQISGWTADYIVTEEYLSASKLDSNGVEIGGVTISFQPITENGKTVGYNEVYHAIIDEVRYDVTYDMILERFSQKPPQ